MVFPYSKRAGKKTFLSLNVSCHTQFNEHEKVYSRFLACVLVNPKWDGFNSTPGVNFINIFCANFCTIVLIAQLFSSYMWIEKSCSNFHTKNSREKCWWNWRTVDFTNIFYRLFLKNWKSRFLRHFCHVVSISSTFYARVFHTKKLFSSYILAKKSGYLFSIKSLLFCDSIN